MAAPKGNKNHLKHGLSHTRIDNIYKSMIDRCNNSKSYNYLNYGARGITVCDEWKKDKTKFFKWAYENNYQSNLTLDRKDNTKGYSPENCRWVTYKVQNNNKRSNKYIEAFGECKTLSQWSESTGIKLGTLWSRLKKGWEIEKALTTPLKKNQFV